MIEFLKWAFGDGPWWIWIPNYVLLGMAVRAFMEWAGISPF